MTTGTIMKIKSIRSYAKNLALSKPYSIATRTISDVENIFLEVELENGIVGIGAANPAPEVVGESPADTLANCQTAFFGQLEGRDIRHFQQMIFEAHEQFPHLPGTQAILDIALHDAFGQFLGIPVAAFYGQKIQSLPTSVTIGIMPLEETLEAAEDYKKQGFIVLKVKLGMNVEGDVERVRKLRERFGSHFTIRVDANQGYSLEDLKTFYAGTNSAGVELVEQPMLVGTETELLQLPAGQRRLLAADESLKSPVYAMKLAQEPHPFGIFNIKLMKCGGIVPALEIGSIARHGGIDLFWGCNDESIVSITAALHAAFACSNTRYIDLDGSLDLAEDVVQGGFVIEKGLMRPTGQPGLGLSLLLDR